MLAIIIAALLSASPKGQIAYLSASTDADRCVYVLDLATHTRTRVGPGKGDGPPRWSPDGSMLAFQTRTDDEGIGIYIVDADGASGRYLRHKHRINRDPQWSPDGAKLAYGVATGLERQIAVYTLKDDEERIWGGDRTSLMRPRWLARELAMSLLTPEGGPTPRPGLVFGQAGDRSIGLIAAGLTGAPGVLSTDLFIVTESEAVPLPARALPGRGRYAEWAAEPGRGHMLAYESDDGGDREIFVYSRRGVLNLSNHRAADWNPVWAPGHTWLAFESFRDGRRGVYRVHRDTARVFRIAVSDEADSWSPSWSPNARWVAHVSDWNGLPKIYISEAKTRETARVTDGPAHDGAPAWRPRP